LGEAFLDGSGYNISNLKSEQKYMKRTNAIEFIWETEEL